MQGVKKRRSEVRSRKTEVLPKLIFFGLRTSDFGLLPANNPNQFQKIKRIKINLSVFCYERFRYLKRLVLLGDAGSGPA